MFFSAIIAASCYTLLNFSFKYPGNIMKTHKIATKIENKANAKCQNLGMVIEQLIKIVFLVVNLFPLITQGI